MHLALPIGLLLMHALAFMHTPMGHLMVAAAWEWVKRHFGKIADKARNGIVIVISKKSPKGELHFLFSTHDGETASRLLEDSRRPRRRGRRPQLSRRMRCSCCHHRSARSGRRR